MSIAASDRTASERREVPLPGSVPLPRSVPWTRSLDIAITGIGLVTPLGLGVDENLDSLRAGRSGVRLGAVPGLATAQPVPVAPSPEVALASILRVPKSQKYMNRPLELAVAAALEAVESSGIRNAAIDPERLAIYTGSGQTGLDFGEFYRSLSYAWRDGREPDFKYLGGKASRLIDPYFSLRTLSNAAVALISAETGARGPSGNFVQSDTASASALSAACNDLVEDRCDAVIAGGYDCLLQPGIYYAFEAAGLLSPTLTRMLDSERNGVVLGEGAAFFLLERRSDAILRGAPILGELIAIECTTGADHRRMSSALAAAIRLATEPAAGLGFVVTRGLGMPGGDGSELDCLAGTVGASVPVTALKGLTGFLGAATAAAELALGVLAARDGFIPGITGLTAPRNPGVDLVVEESRALRADPTANLFVSASWGGTVSAILAGVSGA